MSETPRVDELTHDLIDHGADITYPALRYCKLAEQLERELAQARKQIDTHFETICRQADCIAQARKDAERYRWLRFPARMHTITVEQWGKTRMTLHGNALDSAIDAAMGEQAQEK